MRPEEIGCLLEVGHFADDLFGDRVDQHPEESPFALCQEREIGCRCTLEEFEASRNPLFVVNVEHPSERPPELGLIFSRGKHWRTSGLEEFRPASVPFVEFFEFKPGFPQEVDERYPWRCHPELPELLDLRRPSRGNRIPEALEHDLLCLLVQLQMTPGRQIGKPLTYCLFDAASRPTDEGTKASVDTELLSVHAYEVEDCAEGLVLGSPEPTSELLHEQRGTIGGSEHQDRVDRGEIYSFVEES